MRATFRLPVVLNPPEPAKADVAVPPMIATAATARTRKQSSRHAVMSAFGIYRSDYTIWDNRTAMHNVGGWVRNSFSETRDFIGSTVEGTNNALKSAAPDAVPAFSRAARHSWGAAAIGACIGVAGGILNDDRKPTRGAIVGGFVGAAVGLSAGMAWNARAIIAAIAGNAARNSGQLRDAYWLARNPINYA